MTEETETRKEAIMGSSNDGYTIAVLILIVAIVFVLCSALYVNTSSQDKSEVNSSLKMKNVTEEVKITLPKSMSKKLRINHQPNCTMQEHISKTLQNISSELYVKRVLCTPEDVNNAKKHFVPTTTIKNAEDPRGNFIMYFAVGLLLASLVAAFLDVYKVKGKPSKNKPPLTKRCSLADLTVLRHNRRESMKKDFMVDDHRVPLKLLGARPVDFRRCSVPVHIGEISYGSISPRQNSRKSSLDYEAHSYDTGHTRGRLMRRF